MAEYAIASYRVISETYHLGDIRLISELDIRLIFPNFQNFACREEYLKDNKHNLLDIQFGVKIG